MDVVTFDDLQSGLRALYPNVDRTTGEPYGFDYLFGYTTNSTGVLTRGLWQRNSKPQDFFRLVSWLVSIANEFDINLGQAVIRKYPGVCPYCLVAPCRCSETNKRPAIDIPTHKIGEELEARALAFTNTQKVTFELCQKLLRNIYPNNRSTWQDAGPWKVCAKLQEELSEVHEAATDAITKKKSKDLLAEELADCIAWATGAWTIVHKDIVFSHEISSYYKGGCPACGKGPCKCEKYGARSKSLPSIETLGQLKEYIFALAEEVNLSEEDRESLLASFKQAEDVPTESATRRVLQQVDDLSEKALSQADKAEKITKKGLNTANAIRSIIDIFGQGGGGA
ncbi:MAG: hypothetical protein AAFN94_13320 [Pseudomonadota bacterium]